MVQFYTINCPACDILEQRLKDTNIPYERIDDIKLIQKEGIFQLPMLKVEGKILTYKQALDWLKEQKQNAN